MPSNRLEHLIVSSAADFARHLIRSNRPFTASDWSSFSQLTRSTDATIATKTIYGKLLISLRSCGPLCIKPDRSSRKIYRSSQSDSPIFTIFLQS